MPTKKSNKKCLNCSNELVDEYCSKCSQSAATGRMAFNRLFTEEFIGNTFNLNIGFIRTCIDLILRPGELITNYLAGQRKSYFHFAGLLIVLLAIDALLLSFANNSESTMFANMPTDVENKPSIITHEGIKALADFQKFALALSTPLLALTPYFLFKKNAYYFAEHVVIAWFFLAMYAITSLVNRVIGTLPISVELYTHFMYVTAVIYMLLGLRFYWQLSAFGSYKTVSRIVRTACVTITSIIFTQGVQTYFVFIGS